MTVDFTACLPEVIFFVGSAFAALLWRSFIDDEEGGGRSAAVLPAQRLQTIPVDAAAVLGRRAVLGRVETGGRIQQSAEQHPPEDPAVDVFDVGQQLADVAVKRLRIKIEN